MTDRFPLSNAPNVWTLENRRRPFFHQIPWMTDADLTIKIIREAEKFWQADFSPSIALIEKTVAERAQKPINPNIQHQLAK